MWALILGTITVMLGVVWGTRHRPRKPTRAALTDRLAEALTSLAPQLQAQHPDLGQPHPHKLQDSQLSIWFHLTPQQDDHAQVIDGSQHPPLLYLSLHLRRALPATDQLHISAASASPHIHATGTRRAALTLFEPEFDQQLRCQGDMSVALARLGPEQRAALLALTPNLYALSHTPTKLQITWHLYPDSNEAALIALIPQALAISEHLSAPLDLPRALLERLKHEPDPGRALLILKSLLRDHESSSSGQGAIKWALRQPQPALHIELAATCPHLINKERHLRPKLLNHAADLSLEPAQRAKCLHLLFKHAQGLDALHELLAQRSVTEPDEHTRAIAIDYALRALQHTDAALNAAVVTLSAQHILRARGLEPIMRERITRRLQDHSARPDKQAHLHIARHHADRAARYGSLSALLELHAQDLETITLTLEVALYEREQLLYEVASRALTLHHHGRWLEPLQQLTDAPHTPAPIALIAMAHLPSPCPQTLWQRWLDAPLEPHTRLRTLDLLLEHPSLDHSPLLHCLNEPPSSPRHKQLTPLLKHLLKPRHLSKLELTAAIKLRDDHIQATLIEQLRRLARRYTSAQRREATRLILAMMEYPNMVIWPAGIDALGALADQDAIAPMSALFERTFLNAPRYAPFFTILAQGQALLERIKQQTQLHIGALSLSHEQDTQGALSISQEQGQLALLDPHNLNN